MKLGARKSSNKADGKPQTKYKEGGVKTRLSSKDIDDEDPPERLSHQLKLKGSIAKRRATRWLAGFEAETGKGPEHIEWGIPVLSEARIAKAPVPLFRFMDLDMPDATADRSLDWVQRSEQSRHDPKPEDTQADKFPPLLERMAEITGFFWPENLVRCWYAGTIRPSEAEMVVLARALDLNPHWLATGEMIRTTRNLRVELSAAIARIEGEIAAQEWLKSAEAPDLASRLRKAMIRRGAMKEDAAIEDGLQYLTGSRNWFTSEEIETGQIQDPQRLDELADQCFVPRSWLAGHKDGQVSLVAFICGMNSREETLALLAQATALDEGQDDPGEPEEGDHQEGDETSADSVPPDDAGDEKT